MTRLADEAAGYARLVEERRRVAAARAALQLCCGIDLPEALSAEGGGREMLVARLRRVLERERLKGTRRHWSYSLDRHIALKQALDLLQGGKRADAGRNRRTRRP